MDDKLKLVLRALVQKTANGKLGWEDASSLVRGDRFRANFGDAVVELSTDERELVDDHGDDFLATVYRVQVLNSHALVVESRDFFPATEDRALVVDLFERVRASARKRESVLDSLLEKLGK